MHLGLLGAGVAVTIGVVIGSATTFVDAQAGEGTSKAATNFGITKAAELWGSAAQLPAQTAEQVRPAIGSLANQAGSVAGGVANSTTPTTSPGDYYGTPSDGTKQP